MSASNVLETALLALLFENTNSGLNIGDATGLRGSTTAGSVYISLHTADPGEAGTQTTTESAYTNYARQAVARSTAGWTSTAGVCDNDAAIPFPACGVTGSTITHVAIGSNVSTAGDLYMTGTAALTVSNGVTPQFAIGALDITLD